MLRGLSIYFLALIVVATVLTFLGIQWGWAQGWTSLAMCVVLIICLATAVRRWSILAQIAFTAAAWLAHNLVFVVLGYWFGTAPDAATRLPDWLFGPFSLVIPDSVLADNADHAFLGFLVSLPFVIWAMGQSYLFANGRIEQS